MKFQQNVDLQSLNTMAVPSVARYFFIAQTLEDIRLALAFARKEKLSVFVLGGGSNSLLPEKLDGLVIQPLLKGVECIENSAESSWVRAGAGENWHDFVMHCLSAQYYGLENLAYIPGLVGAAPIQNIGAYGVELKDVFHSLEAMDRATGEMQTFNFSDCEFAYRESVFKNRLKDRMIIASVTFRLQRQAACNLSYPALASALEREADGKNPEKVAEAVIKLRQRKLPDPEYIPNAGSFFKNPVITEAKASALKLAHPKAVIFDVDGSHKKVAAGWLIDAAGWKGREAFQVRVHDQQALVLTNPNRVSRHHILTLADAIRKDIEQRFGITLEREPGLFSE